MLKKSKDVIACVVDHGLFLDAAVKLSQTYKKVYYCIPSAIISPFPNGFQARIGYGIDGIEVIPSLQGPWFDSIDLFIFTDNGFGLWQEDLIKRGKKVFGSRMGEELELDRDGCKQLMRQRGLPVGKYEVVKGVDKLRDYLKSNKEQFVKISRWRGLFESFYSKDYKTIEPKLDDIQQLLGPSGAITEFIIEARLPDEDMAEVGIDTFCINGQYPNKTMVGVESKDANYVAIYKDWKDIPEPITRFNTKTKDIMMDCGYSGPISTELRIGKDHKPYTLDICARFGAPPSELYIEQITNFAEICWYGANGLVIEPIVKYKYGVEVLIESNWSTKHWQPIVFSESFTQWISLRNYCVIDKKYYIIPQNIDNNSIGAAIGLGNSIDEARDMVKEVCNSIEGYDIKCKVDSLSSIDKTIEQLGLLKLNFFK